MKQSNRELAAVIDSLASACKDHYRGFLEMTRKYKITPKSRWSAALFAVHYISFFKRTGA